MVVVLAGCDTGDGTTLQTPTLDTTIPPLDTTPLATAPLVDGQPAVEPPPLQTVPLDILEDLEAGVTDPLLEPALDVDVTSDFQVFAPWAPNGTIDPTYTCDGVGVSPAVSWTGLPAGTTEVAISFVDDSQFVDGRPLIHWVMGGIDASIGRIGDGDTPPGAIRSLNSFGDLGYSGACPDPGDTHTYVLTVWALGQQLEAVDGDGSAELLDLVAAVSIDSSSTIGTATR